MLAVGVDERQSVALGDALCAAVVERTFVVVRVPVPAADAESESVTEAEAESVPMQAASAALAW